MAETIFPGYKDKLWNRKSDDAKYVVAVGFMRVSLTARSHPRLFPDLITSCNAANLTQAPPKPTFPSRRRSAINALCKKDESAVATHKQWASALATWKGAEKSMAPSYKFRKPSVDWRRQVARGTVHTGRWYEGPPVAGSNQPSDYTPGNTHDRLASIRAPFTDAEWEERKNYRSFDLLNIAYGTLGIFVAYRLTSDWPVVWTQ